MVLHSSKQTKVTTPHSLKLCEHFNIYFGICRLLVHHHEVFLQVNSWILVQILYCGVSNHLFVSMLQFVIVNGRNWLFIFVFVVFRRVLNFDFSLDRSSSQTRTTQERASEAEVTIIKFSKLTNLADNFQWRHEWLPRWNVNYTLCRQGTSALHNIAVVLDQHKPSTMTAEQFCRLCVDNYRNVDVKWDTSSFRCALPHLMNFSRRLTH